MMTELFISFCFGWTKVFIFITIIFYYTIIIFYEMII